MRRTALITAIVAACVQVSPALAKPDGLAKRPAARQAPYDRKRTPRPERLRTERYGPSDLSLLSSAGPSTGSATPISLAGGANGCWDCSYAPKRMRQFLPGDMTFKFRPVGGTLNYHF